VSIRPIPAVVLIACLGCATPQAEQPGPVADSEAASAPRAADRAELLRLHERQRAAHLQRRARFQEYLDAATFQAWDDIVPPRIRISPDGQMAYVIVEKRVHLTSRDSSGVPESERTRFAWISVYEKQGSRWRLSAIASTERPDSL
jgi:hypothetical protein